MSNRPNLPSYPVEIDLGTYIVERWKQLGVGHVFGVPGDFNLGVSTSRRGDRRVRFAISKLIEGLGVVIFAGDSSWIILKKIRRSIGWGLVRLSHDPLGVSISRQAANRWVVLASELGAGYACDGYARVKRDLSVLVSEYHQPFHLPSSLVPPSLTHPRTPCPTPTYSDLRSRRNFNLQPDLRDASRTDPMPPPRRSTLDLGAGGREVVTPYPWGWEDEGV